MAVRRHLLLLLGIAACALLFGHVEAPRSAEAVTSAMELRVVGASCDDPLTPTSCTAGVGEAFTMFIDVTKAPGAGYIAFQSEIDYDGLMYLPTADAGDEVVWPDTSGTLDLRAPGSPTGTEGAVNHAAATATVAPFPLSFHTGPVLAIELECSATGTNAVELVPEGSGNADGSLISDSPGGGLATSDSLTVVCTAYPPFPDMELDVASGGTCSDASWPTVCTVPVNGAFTLVVDTTTIPAAGYAGFQSLVDYENLLANGGSYQPRVAASDEIVWPDAALHLRAPGSPSGLEGTVGHGALTAIIAPYPVSTFTGTLLELDFECGPTPSSSTLYLVPQSDYDPPASAYVSAAGAPTAVADALTIECEAAPVGTAEMQLNVPLGASCNDAQAPTLCTVGLSQSFTLSVDVTDHPAGGYIGFQTELDYTELVSNGGSYAPTGMGDDEIVWPDAAIALRDPSSPTGTEGNVLHGSLSALVPPYPQSTHAGSVVEVEMMCGSSPSSNAIELVPYSAGHVVGSSLLGGASTFIPTSDTLTVACTGSFSELFYWGSSLAGTLGEWTCEEGEPHFHDLAFHYTWGTETTGESPPLAFRQEPSPALQWVECYHAGELVGVKTFDWTSVSDVRGLVVDAASGIPIPGTQVTLQEFVGGSWQDVPGGPPTNPQTSRLGGEFGWDVGSGSGQYRVTTSPLGCTSATSATFSVPATDVVVEPTCDDTDGDGLPDFADNITIFDNFALQQITLPDNPDTDGDTIPDGADDCEGDGYTNLVELRDFRSDPCEPETGDMDGDGCADMEELQTSEELGGRRDSINPYDFFDIDGNGLVDLFTDIFGVAGAFGLTPSDPGYSPALDRSAPPPQGDQWDMGPPDGTVDLFIDVFGAANQFGHSCQAAP